jgi:hypothetical protein
MLSFVLAFLVQWHQVVQLPEPLSPPKTRRSVAMM